MHMHDGADIERAAEHVAAPGDAVLALVLGARVHVEQLVGHQEHMRGVAQACLHRFHHRLRAGAAAQHARGLAHDQRLARADRAGVDHRQLEQPRAPRILARLEALGHGTDHGARGMRVQLAAAAGDGEQQRAVA